jgi:ABC-type enterochelin transport system permease subunit
MPVLFPRAIAMAFELAAYGFFSGFLYNKLPKKNASIYISLLISMVLGRLVWGVVQFLCAGLDIQKFNLSLFWAGAVIEAIPGIILQIVLIPVLVIALEKHKVKNKN